MYTRKNKKNLKKAISIIHKNDSNITGCVKFVNTKRGVKVIYDIKGMKNLAHTFANAYASISTTSPGCTELDAKKLSPVAHVKNLLMGF